MSEGFHDYRTEKDRPFFRKYWAGHYQTTERLEEVYKEWKEGGYFVPPYVKLNDEQLAELRSKCDLNEPPPGFSSGPLYTSALRIYYLEFAGQRFWIYDHDGFICSTASAEVVVILLEAEGRQLPDPSRPHYRMGAREFLFPGKAEEAEKKALAMRERATLLGDNMRRRMAEGPAGTPGFGTPDDGSKWDGEAVLRTLGLDT